MTEQEKAPLAHREAARDLCYALRDLGPLDTGSADHSARKLILEAFAKVGPAATSVSPAPESEVGPYSGALRIPIGADLLALSRRLRTDAEQTRVRHSVRTAYCAVNIDDLVRYTAAVEAALAATSGSPAPDYPPLGVDEDLLSEAQDILRDYCKMPSHALAVEALLAENARLRAAPPVVATSAPAWIPVGERLPEPTMEGEVAVWEMVLIARECCDDVAKVGYYNQYEREWRGVHMEYIHDVTHWMPLPSPPTH